MCLTHLATQNVLARFAFFPYVTALLLLSSATARAQATPTAPVVVVSPEAPAASAVPAATVPPGSGPPTPALRVHHVPVLSAPADHELTITATVEAAHVAREIALYVRRSGTVSFEPLFFKRLSTDAVLFSVTLPADRMTAGVLEYYIASVGINQKPNEPELLHFASPQYPHPMSVLADAELRWRQSLLQLHVGNRSRAQAHFEYVNFGSRTDQSGTAVEDAYYRAEADYTYRFLGWVYSIRLGAGLLLGRTYVGQGSSIAQIPDVARCNSITHQGSDCRVGLYYGFTELRFRFGRFLRVDVHPILGVGPQSFDGGGSLQFLLGYDPGRHLALGFEGVTSIGVRGWLRLAWDTVPHIPMAFVINLENFPNNDALAMRLLMNFGYRFHRHFSVDAVAGYAARGWQIGGPDLGCGVIGEW